MARVTARCYQGTILYLSQCWPRSMLHYSFSHVDLFQFNLRKQWVCVIRNKKKSNIIGFHTYCITLVLISHDMVMSHWFIQLNADRNVVWLRFDFFKLKISCCENASIFPSWTFIMLLQSRIYNNTIKIQVIISFGQLDDFPSKFCIKSIKTIFVYMATILFLWMGTEREMLFFYAWTKVLFHISI